MIRIAACCALAGAIAAPLSAQTSPLAPGIADMSAAVPMSGRWTYWTVAGGGEARFLDSASRPQLVIACTRATRQLTIARPAAGAAPFLQVWSSSERRNLPASFIPAAGEVRATLQFSDRLLDALAQSRGRIAVGISGQPMLVAPVWGEIGRVIEECRL